MAPFLRLTENKDEWGEGPWQEEPDRLEFEHAGLPCLLKRATFGSWCGYAAVPPGHPLHGKRYQDVDDISVHGGLTYGDACQGSICHAPKPGESADVWWFGFDCNHAFDLAPGMPATARWGIYKDIGYARRETERLAEQLARAAT